MSNFYTEDFLMHHGVLGMKWGVRKEKRRTKKEINDIKKKKIIIGLSAAAITITGAEMATAIFASGIPAGIPISSAVSFGGNFALSYLEKAATQKISELK